MRQKEEKMRRKWKVNAGGQDNVALVTLYVTARDEITACRDAEFILKRDKPHQQLEILTVDEVCQKEVAIWKQ